jgi:mannose-6-phosphate isomerase
VCAKFEASELNDENCSDGSHKRVLRELFTSFMECGAEIATVQIQKLVMRLSTTSSSSNGVEGSAGANADDSEVRALILRLHADYPDDRGALCPLLLNRLHLSEGEAFFMGPNEPHAYISGDCVECMALSDNVVRAGLTPKFRDVETLINMLNYTYGKPQMLKPSKLDDHTLLYRPPASLCAEFEVEVTTLPADSEPYQLSVLECASLVLVLKGVACTITNTSSDETNTCEVTAGSVLLIPANTAYRVSGGSDGAVLYRAHVNLGDESILESPSSSATKRRKCADP